MAGDHFRRERIAWQIFFFLIELILHDAGYTKGISYSSAPLLHKETKDKKTRNIVNKNDLSIMT